MVTYVDDIKKAKEVLIELLGYKKKMDADLKGLEEQLKQGNELLSNLEKARIVAQNVANIVQKNLEYRISGIVTMALSSVFPEPDEFKVSFVQRRNQTECDMFFIQNGNESDPMESSGGGVVDVVSFALRMSIWSIKKTRPIQILDEPFKFLSRDLQERASDMVKQISDKLGIQIIMVSHLPGMIDSADKTFVVEQMNGVSILK